LHYTGWPTDLTWYKLLYDWQTIIGGVFALIAGYIAYTGARCAAKDQIQNEKELRERDDRRKNRSILVMLKYAIGCRHRRSINRRL
jgi:hypothetical protein